MHDENNQENTKEAIRLLSWLPPGSKLTAIALANSCKIKHHQAYSILQERHDFKRIENNFFIKI